MPPSKNDDLRKAYRMTAFVGLAMIASVLVYAIVVEVIKRQNAPFGGFSPMPEYYTTLRHILLVLAAVVFFAVRPLQRFMLTAKGQLQGSRTTSQFAPEVQRLMTASIVTYALCESVAIYGLVLFMLHGNSGDFYLFMVLSIFYFSTYFPKYDKWEKWIAQQQQRGQARGRQG